MLSVLNLFPHISIIWLFAFSIIILLIRLFSNKFYYYWLLSTFGIFVAWLMVFFSRVGLPYIYDPANTSAFASALGIPSLVVDSISWPYAVAIVTFTLVVYLTFLMHGSTMDWLALGSGLGFTAWSLLVIQSRDIATLMMGWAAIDIMEFLILIVRAREPDSIKNVIKIFAVRFSSILLFVWSTSDPFILIICAGLRIAIIPFGIFSEKQFDLTHNFFYYLSIVAPVSALIVFVRISLSIESFVISNLLNIFLIFVGLYGVMKWISTKNAFDGRRFWVLVTGLLSVLAAFRGFPGASVSWGIAMIMAGGIIFFDEKLYRKPIFSFIGLISITSIPFMPTWDGAALYTSIIGLTMGVFVLIQSFLVYGYYKHSKTTEQGITSTERWIQLIYPLRFIIIFITYWLLAYYFWRDGILLTNSPQVIQQKQIVDYGIGFVIILLGGLMIFIFRKQTSRPWKQFQAIQQIFSIDWINVVVNKLFILFSRIINGFNGLIEGGGGVLITFLLLALLITFFIQGG